MHATVAAAGFGGRLCADGINELSMPLTLTTEVRMIKGVGPQRAELLAKRGIFTLEDLLLYLPFRYEDASISATSRTFSPTAFTPSARA